MEGDRVGWGHCIPVFSWHVAAFLPTEASFPHSPTCCISQLAMLDGKVCEQKWVVLP